MRRIGFSFLPLALACAQPASAYCFTEAEVGPRFYSIEKEFARSRYVATVRVESEIWLGLDGKPKALTGPFRFGGPRPWGFDDYMGAYYDVVVTEPFKGNPPRRLRLFSENSTARFWLRRGQDYVVFADNGKFDAPVNAALTVDACGNSPMVRTKAKKLVQTLRKLRTR